MYTILFEINENGWKLSSKGVSTLKSAEQMVDSLSSKAGIRGVRLLQDVVESPYEKLYNQLYDDFVKQFGSNAVPKVVEEKDTSAEIR